MFGDTMITAVLYPGVLDFVNNNFISSSVMRSAKFSFLSLIDLIISESSTQSGINVILILGFNFLSLII